MPSGRGHTQSWRVQPNLVICPATGPPPRLSVTGPGDPRTPSQQETEEFIHTRQRRTLKAIKSGILGLLAPGGGPRGKLPITRREKRGAGLEGGSHTQPRARLHVASSPSLPPAQAGTRVHVCTRLCSLGCSQRLRSSLRVPLSPLTRRLTGGWPHPSSTGLSHGTRLTALSEGRSQSPADRPHPNPAPAGQGSARVRQRPRAGTSKTQGKLASSASPRLTPLCSSSAGPSSSNKLTSISWFPTI